MNQKFIILIFLLFTYQLYALPKYQFSIGFNSSSFEHSKSHAKLGPTFGVYKNISKRNNFYFNYGLTYSTKQSRFENISYYKEVEDVYEYAARVNTDISIGSLEFTCNLVKEINIFSKTSFLIQAGLFLSMYKNKAASLDTIEELDPVGLTNYDFESDQDNYFYGGIYGLNLGAGIKINRISLQTIYQKSYRDWYSIRSIVIKSKLDSFHLLFCYHY